MNIDYHVLIDASLDECPIPTIKTKAALDSMSINEILKLVACKEGTSRNIKTFVRNNHCELIHEDKVEDGFVFYIRKTQERMAG